MKKALRIVIAILFALVIALMLLPVIFKEELVTEIKNGINERLEAEVDFEDVDISLLRSFPDLNVQLLLFSIDGKDEFEGVRLFAADKINASLGLKGLFFPDKGLEIHDLDFDKAYLHIKVNENGSANYDIVKSESETNSLFFGDIKRYSVNDSRLIYEDLQTGVFSVLDSIEHTGSGKFNYTKFDLKTKTGIASANVNYLGVNYIENATLQADLVLGVDLDENIYTIKDNNLSLNSLDLQSEGFFQLLEDAYLMDLKIKAPGNDIASILSVVPKMYTQDYNNIKSQGTGKLEASVKGKYSSKDNTYPAVDVSVLLADGRLQYPGAAYPLESLQADLNIKASEGNWNDLVLDLNRLDFTINKRPFAAKLKMLDPMSDTRYIGQVSGSIDLGDLDKTIPLDGIDFKTGLLNAKMNMDVRNSHVSEKDYSKLNASGDFSLKNLALVYNNADIRLTEATASLSPLKIETRLQGFTIDESDLDAFIQIDNPLDILFGNKLELLNAKITSRYIDANRLANLMPQKQDSFQQEPAQTQFSSIEILKSNIDCEVLKLDYQDHTIENLNLSANYAEDKLDIKNAALSLDGDAMKMRGKLENINAYMFENDTLTGTIFWEAESLDMNRFSNPKASSPVKTQQVNVPANMNIELHGEIGKLIYNKLVFENFTAKLKIEDEILSLLNGSSKLFTGNIAFEGSYNTQQVDNALFDFRYDLSQLPYASLFKASEVFASLNPIAEFVEGRFNSTLVISGPLGKDMMPKLDKITASGVLETFETKVSGFPVVNQMSDKLGLAELKQWYITDSKNWFDIKDGRIDVKPYTLKVKDMQYDISGNYTLDKEIDFKVRARIPREKLASNSVTGQLDKGLGFLEKQASAMGIDISVGSEILVDILIGGSLTKPNLKLVPAGTAGAGAKDVLSQKISDETSKVKDSIQSEIKKQTQTVKDSVASVLDENRTKAENAVKDQLDKTGKEIKTNVKNEIDSTLIKMGIDSTNIIKDKLDKVIGGNTTQSEIDSIKSKLNNWNPFKKKTKGQ